MIHCSRVVFVVSFLSVWTSLSIAQDNEYEKWLKEEEGRIKLFKEERDKEFTEFLKLEWKQIELLKGESPIEKPKPIQAPVYEGTASVLPPSTIIPVIETELPKKPEPTPEIKKPVPTSYAHTAEIKYFEAPLKLEYNEIPAIELRGSVTKEQISKAWDVFSEWNYKPILEQITKEKKQHQLNDWGFVLLVYQTGKTFYSNAPNKAALFTWYLLSKAGYEAKIGYNQKVMMLLFPAGNKLYSCPYFVMKGDERRFYAPQVDRMVPSESSLYTYNGKYPGADKSLQFDVRSIPELLHEKMTKEYSFSYGDKTYRLTAEFSRDAVRFFEYYPQTNYEVYFNAPFSQDASNSIMPQLADIIKGKSENEAVNILLRFVQTAFPYKTDPEQFGREKSFFPDETLFYPYSDCEDRAILFAYLVRNLIHYEVVGLQFPEHIATAVKFQGNVAGDAIEIGGTTYLICDPTFINADLGMCMPQFKGVTPTVIAIHSK